MVCRNLHWTFCPGDWADICPGQLFWDCHEETPRGQLQPCQKKSSSPHTFWDGCWGTSITWTQQQHTNCESGASWHVFLRKHLLTKLTSPCIVPSIGRSAVKYTATGLWNSGNVFFGEMTDTSLSDSLMGKSVFHGCQENSTYWNADCKFGGGGLLI